MKLKTYLSFWLLFLVPIAMQCGEPRNAASDSTPPAKTVFPPDPDILGFKLLKTPDEVLSHLAKQGFKVETTSKVEPFAAIATRLAASIQGKKAPPRQPVSVVDRIKAFKVEDGFQVQISFQFVEDISLTPSVSKCYQIYFTRMRLSKPGPDPEAREKLKAALAEKYGPPLRDEGGLYYANKESNDGERPDVNAPNFRFILFQMVDGSLTIKDLGYQRQKLGLKQKRLEEIEQSLKVELPTPKV